MVRRGKSMGYRGIHPDTVEYLSGYRDISWDTVMYNGNSVGHREKSVGYRIHRGIPWEVCGIPLDTVGYRAIPWESVGYRGTV